MSGREELVKKLGAMSIIEMADFIKELEGEWGVSAAAAVAVGGAAAPAAEEQTEFTLVLESCGDKKIDVIKEIRAITGLGLKEAKDLADNGGNVKEGMNKKDAEEAKAKLAAAGAKVALK